MDTRVEGNKCGFENLDLSIVALTNSFLPPCENKEKSQLTRIATLDQKTFHTTHKVIEESIDEIKTGYLKDNPDTAISELEAIGAAYHRMFAPRYTPNTNAVYDSRLKKYVGVMSEEFYEFKSTYQDPLKEEDLKTDFLEKIPLDVIDKLEGELYELERRMEAVERKFKKVNDVEKKLTAKLDKLNTTDPLTESKEIEDSQTEKEYEENALQKSKLYREKTFLVKKIREFYKNIHTTYSLTKKSLENYRIKKGLAITLTCSYLLMEDDLHQLNLSKDGRRIDFDMILWPLTYNFKDSTWAVFRKPKSETFKITPRDILEFPDLKDATPFYWPTQPFRLIAGTVNSYVSTFVPVSANAYPYVANAFYQKLKKDPIFVHHQFSTLAKFLLTDEKMYQEIALKHIREDSSYQGKMLHVLLAKEYIAPRIAELKRVVTLIDSKEIGKDKDKDLLIREFARFFEKQSEHIAAELTKDLLLQKVTVDSMKLEKTRLEILAQCTSNLWHVPEPAPSIPGLVIAPPVAVTESKEIKEIPIVSSSVSLESIKKQVIAAMNEYKNPGGVRGFFGGINTIVGGKGGRNHVPMAEELILICETIKANPTNDKENAIHLVTLRNNIQEKIRQCGQGAMHEALRVLTDSINKTLELPLLQSIRPNIKGDSSPA